MRQGQQCNRCGFRLGHDSRGKRTDRFTALPEHRLADLQPAQPGCQITPRDRVDRVGAERRAGWGDEADGCTACEVREQTAELVSKLLSQRRIDLQVIHECHVRGASPRKQVAAKESCAT